MHMPVLKDKSGNVYEPSNLLMHNNESNFMFIDKNDSSKVVNFDLEKGQVVEEYQVPVAGGINQLTSERKND